MFLHQQHKRLEELRQKPLVSTRLKRDTHQGPWKASNAFLITASKVGNMLEQVRTLDGRVMIQLHIVGLALIWVLEMTGAAIVSPSAGREPREPPKPSPADDRRGNKAQCIISMKVTAALTISFLPATFTTVSAVLIACLHRL